MAKRFYYVETDSEAVLKLSGDLTGSTVTASVRPAGTSLPPATPAVDVVLPKTVILDISALTQGVYELQFEQNQSGTIAHYPNKGFDLLVIGEEL